LNTRTKASLFAACLLALTVIDVTAAVPEPLEDRSTDALVYSTFFGGSEVDYGNEAIVTTWGEVVVVGYTLSDDLPVTQNAFQKTNLGNSDGFIAVLSPDGSSLRFCSYLGGSDVDMVMSVGSDAAGDIYVCGITNSTDFPTTAGSLQPDLAGGFDAFVTKIDPSTGNVSYSTLFGGSGMDGGLTEGGRSVTLQVDGSSRVWLTGLTTSTDLPTTTGCLQDSYGGGDRDGFYLRLDASGSGVQYCSYLGGSDDDVIVHSYLGAGGKLLVCGMTYSDDFPVTNGAFQTRPQGSADGFVTRFTADGGSLDVSTIFGGSSPDVVMSAKEAADGDMYLAGYTVSTDLPISSHAYQRNLKGPFDQFVAKLDHDASSLNWSTYLGGSDADLAISVCPMEEGVCVLGYSTSDDFPVTSDTLQDEFGGDYDVVMCVLDGEGDSLVYSTYMGGTRFDVPSTISTSGNSTVLLTGVTASSEFPVTDDAYQKVWKGGDAFVSRFVIDTVPPVADAGPDVEVDQHTTVQFNGSASSDTLGIANWTWTLWYSGTQYHLYGPTPSFTFDDAGTYTVNLVVTDRGGLFSSDDVTVTVLDVTPPVADAGTSHTIEEDRSVVLDGTGSTDNVEVVNWTWTFDYNGTTVTLFGPDPEFTFQEPGEYNITLNVTDATGLWDTDHVTVHVRDVTDPMAEVPDDISVDQHEAVIMDGAGSTDNVAVINWTWGFIYRGFPMSLFGQVVEFTFDDAGQFEVTLTVSDAAGNNDMAVFHVTVVDTTPPVAFAGDDREVNPGTNVYFDGTGCSDNVRIASYSWTFVYQGQDIQLDGAMPSYFFEAAGTYEVTLNVTDAAGNVGTDTMNVTVPDLVPPVADAGKDAEVDQRTSVDLDASGSTDNVGIVSWSWTFLVDGEPVTSEEETWSFYFAEAGEYEVTLRVEDAAGFHSEDTMKVTVRDITKPVASPLENITTEQMAEVTLDGSASTDNVGVVDWVWTIDLHGSKNFLEGMTTTYIFGTPGSYIVTLTVEDAAGNSNWSSFVVRVLDNVAPTLPRLKDVEANPGQEVILDGSGVTDNVGVVNWTWTFEEGGKTVVLEGMTAEHTFDEPGEYEVTLTVVDAVGNEATETFTVTVSSGAWVWAVVAIVVVAVAMVAFVLWRRSRG
jgi:PKD repeat protein